MSDSKEVGRGAVEEKFKWENLIASNLGILMKILNNKNNNKKITFNLGILMKMLNNQNDNNNNSIPNSGMIGNSQQTPKKFNVNLTVCCFEPKPGEIY